MQRERKKELIDAKGEEERKRGREEERKRGGEARNHNLESAEIKGEQLIEVKVVSLGEV